MTDEDELQIRENESDALERLNAMRQVYNSCLTEEDFLITVEWLTSKDPNVILNTLTDLVQMIENGAIFRSEGHAVLKKAHEIVDKM